mmetsp:Transcript_86089/g.172378  ORF Transcript_86089/g.172378 Transcript_86089/m.172378 type:complete len:173 (-) Transcript_86089:120-638(-)
MIQTRDEKKEELGQIAPIFFEAACFIFIAIVLWLMNLEEPKERNQDKFLTRETRWNTQQVYRNQNSNRNNNHDHLKHRHASEAEANAELDRMKRNNDAAIKFRHSREYSNQLSNQLSNQNNNHDHLKHRHASEAGAYAELDRMKHNNYDDSHKLRVYYNHAYDGWYVGRSKF